VTGGYFPLSHGGSWRKITMLDKLKFWKEKPKKRGKYKSRTREQKELDEKKHRVKLLNAQNEVHEAELRAKQLDLKEKELEVMEEKHIASKAKYEYQTAKYKQDMEELEEEEPTPVQVIQQEKPGTDWGRVIENVIPILTTGGQRSAGTNRKEPIHPLKDYAENREKGEQ